MIYFSGKTNVIISLVVVLQLLNYSCSRNLYNEQNPKKNETREEIKVSETKKLTVPTDNTTEKNKLKKFLDSGTGKPIDVKNTTPDEIISTARLYIGTPHCMGGTTRKCIDCSGLILVVFAKYGIHLPHNSQEQARYGKKISRMEDLRKGDLVFYKNSYKTANYITHSAIYVGDNKMIHASANSGVILTSLDDKYWYPKFVFGTRIFP
jgi:lipoprotein Spr